MKKLAKKILWNIRGGYRPETFWEKWGETFIDDSWQHKIFPQHRLLLSHIKKERNDKILEIGCGFGRNIKFLIERGIPPQNITGVDISGAMIKSARKFIQNKNVVLKKADILDLPFKSNSFDIVVIYSVLMHVSPEHVEKAINEAERVAKKHIFVIEQNYKPAGKDSNASLYTFLHPYSSLFKKHGLHVLQYKKNKNGYDSFFMIKKSP